VLLLLQVPPATGCVNVVVAPAHTIAEPPIVAVLVFTVTLVIAKHVPILYVILTVPADIPVTTPVEELTVALAELAVLHVPPAVVLLRTVV